MCGYSSGFRHYAASWSTPRFLAAVAALASALGLLGMASAMAIARMVAPRSGRVGGACKGGKPKQG